MGFFSGVTDFARKAVNTGTLGASDAMLRLGGVDPNKINGGAPGDASGRTGQTIKQGLGYRTIEDASGKPISPEFQSLIDKDTGLLGKQYTVGDKMHYIDLNTQGLDQYRKEATRSGGTNSAWADMMLKKQQMDQLQGMNNLNQQQQAQTAGAYDQLSASGGLQSGARERVARDSMRNTLMGQQDLARQGSVNNLGIQTQDEQNRVNQLQQLPGMELQKSGFDMQNQQNIINAKQFDINNAAKEIGSGRDAAWNSYAEKMKGYAAGQQADAQASSSSSCFHPSTMIEMADGSLKPINMIDVGDILKQGGRVTQTIRAKGLDETWYNYRGVIVTASHAVFEDDKWVRVGQSKLKKAYQWPVLVLHNLTCENHIILSEGVIFSDYTEGNDLSDEDSIEFLNEGLHV
jgi:hypothetical protein